MKRDEDETFLTFCDVSLTGDDAAACCLSVTNVAFWTMKTQEKNRI